MLKDKLGRVIRGPTNLAKDVATLIVHAATTGQIMAHKQTIDRRLNTCKKCDKFDGRTCALCGCHMKWKVALASSVCPIGKWG